MQSVQHKLLLVGSQHGNEPFGARLIRDMQIDFSENQDFKMIIANPKALQKKVRYVEENMNQAYRSELDTYEARRAKKIAQEAAKYEYLIDVHTTTSDIPPTLIVADLSHATLRIINSLPFTHIVYFDHFLSANSLIGEHRGSVTFEANTEYVDAHYVQLKEIFYLSCNTLLSQETRVPEKRNLYFASEQLSEQDEVSSDAKNFSRLAGKNFQTFLTQEKAYVGRYIGFKLTPPVIVEA